MSNYIDYNYYSNTFKGTLIPQKEFEKYAIKASNEVRIRIMNKPITVFETQVQNVTCFIADILYNQYLKKQTLENLMNGTIQMVANEKVGDYSKSYSNVTASELSKEIENTTKLIDEEVQSALLFTGLLYSGVVDVR